MIEQNSVDFYNSRLTVDWSNTKNLTASQRDRIRQYGSDAQALLTNRQLAMFIHHQKFEIADQIAQIRGHTQDDNARRIALGNELTGIDSFITTLKRAVYLKDRIGNTQEVPNDLT